MKLSTSLFRSHKPSSFTLIELLVVMAIIAILAGVLFSAASPAINAAKRAKAANTANQIQLAVLNYYAEYNVYPIPTQTTPADVLYDTNATGLASWKTLANALCGNINPNAPGTAVTTGLNSRQIAYLNLNKSDVDADGVPKSPIGLASGTNNYFYIAMDGDYDGVLGAGSSAVTAMPNFTTAVLGTDPPSGGTTTAGVAVWANCNTSASTKNPNFWIKTY